jgi:predicted transcriptional regulator
LAFESWDALARVLTGERMGCCVTSAGTRSRAYARAKALGRNYSNVHADAQALTAAGLLDATDGGVRADYDAIETKIAI